MHVVQRVPAGLGACGYWIEGEADLARAWWGVNNAAAGWELPAPDPNQSYTASYRVTAAFLEWIYESFGEAPIVALDASLRGAVCPGPEFWTEQTGYASVDALWADYVNGVAPAAEPAADPKPVAANPTGDPKPAQAPSMTAEPPSGTDPDPEPIPDGESVPEPSAEPEPPAEAESSIDAPPAAPDTASDADSAQVAGPADAAQAEAEAEAQAQAEAEAEAQAQAEARAQAEANTMPMPQF
jgi:hypothetical protein